MKAHRRIFSFGIIKKICCTLQHDLELLIDHSDLEVTKAKGE
jgi:hypothetical protein